MEFEVNGIAEREVGGVFFGAGDAAMTVGEFDAVRAFLEDFDDFAGGTDLVAVGIG